MRFCGQCYTVWSAPMAKVFGLTLRDRVRFFWTITQLEGLSSMEREGDTGQDGRRCTPTKCYGYSYQDIPLS